MQITVHGVFVRDGADNPVAAFSDPRDARRYLLENHGDANAVVVPLEATVTAASLRGAQDVIDGAFPAAPPPVDPERERVRATLIQERREQQLREEEAAKLDAADKAAAKPEPKGKD